MICDKPMNDCFQHTGARLAGSPLQLKPRGGTDEEEEERTMKETTRPRWQNQEPPLGGAVGGAVR